MKILILIFYLFELTVSIILQFPDPLQRLLYDDSTHTIILASVNHLYSLNASDLSILSDINTSTSSIYQHCPNSNKTHLPKNIYSFPISSYLAPFINQTLNQLLLLANNSVLICSTSNRGGSCQLRSLINLGLIKNSSQRVVSSSPFYPSVGFINNKNQILYISNTYDPLCDPFYEIPTMSGRHLANDELLSIINLKSGQSALQQSTYTLRLLNIRLIKDFFLHYIYAFEYRHFSYFLTIQQIDIHHIRKHRLQTKIVRFCQSLSQSIIKSYVELPLTCGKDYHYLVTAKFSNDNNILYGLFRNTTMANRTTTSHAICSYSIAHIQESFFHAIKNCLVDGIGRRGLDFLSPDSHCIPNKKLNDIDEDYCPDERHGFFQYPIGGQRYIEQNQPIIELNENVNFTSIEMISINNDTIIIVGDDNGTIYRFQTSNTNEIHKQHFQSKLILDLKLINKTANPVHAKLLVLTDNQIIKQNLNLCEQHKTCRECSIASLCHWCFKENKCASTFECIDNKKNNDRATMCTFIEQVVPSTISSEALSTELEVIINTPLRNNLDDYMCRFSFDSHGEIYFTTAVINQDVVTCLPPVLSYTKQAVSNGVLSISYSKNNVTFGSYDVQIINCSKFLSCSSCTLYANFCLWNRKTIRCISQRTDNRVISSHNQLFITNSSQCPSMYLQQSVNRFAYKTDAAFVVQIEQCHQSININACHLYDRRQRFTLIQLNPILKLSANENDLCSLECAFTWSDTDTFKHISFHQPLELHLSVQFSNTTMSTVADTDISVYHCEHMALNCTSCLQIDPSYNCNWCNNMCMLKTQSERCSMNRECLLPVIQTVDPIVLPINGGTFVTIKGKHFDLYDLTIHIADVPCQLIKEKSSHNQLICQSGDAGTAPRAGVTRLKFGRYGPQLYSQDIITYLNPILRSVEPLIGIQNGGTVLTIEGDHLNLGNGHILVLIGTRSCPILSTSPTKIECETRSFPRSMLNRNHMFSIIIDQQTRIAYDQSFTVAPNPVLHSFSKHSQYRSFTKGGHEIIVVGENFQIVQNIQLEFGHLIFASPLFRNDTYLKFLSPAMEELQLKNTQSVEIKIYLDNFNETSSLLYIHDPIIHELEPFVQTYTNELTIIGTNLTAIGHTSDQISVHIGCDLCVIIYLEATTIICQPPSHRPEKYSKSKQPCYHSEHPPIIVSIDNIQAHIGFMVYPQKLLLLGVASGCLLTVLCITLIILFIIWLKLRYNERKYCQQNFHTNTLMPAEIPKEKLYLDSCSLSVMLPLRSYTNYLQLCYYHYCNHLLSRNPQTIVVGDSMKQFKSLIDSNEQFIDCLFKISLQSNDKKILNNLVLTQRHNLKRLLHYKHAIIDFNVCILTCYDSLIKSQIHSLLSQIYHQLKCKILSGPMDVIEQKATYYSLDIDSMLLDDSLFFKTIQLMVHIDLNDNSSNDLVLKITCFTCDTISQVKRKILHQWNSLHKTSINACKLYLLVNHSFSSSSSSSASSTASSSVPLTRKPMLTKALFNRTMKYSTTIINDPYHDSAIVLLSDIDNTNEQMSNGKKLNTLQHYGITTDGHEFKFVISNKRMDDIKTSREIINSSESSCHYCSLSTTTDKVIFNYLPSTPAYDGDKFLLHHRIRYSHLLNHTYEEIDGETAHIIVNSHQSRLFETKSSINALLNSLIELLFTTFIHNDTFFSELMEQYSQLFHQCYAHLIPFMFRNFNCLFDMSIDRFLHNSFNILAMIFQIACCQEHQNTCSLCMDFFNDEDSKLKIQHCKALFHEEIQRTRLYYSNLERCFNYKNSTCEYSSTNMGIDKRIELDDSIFHSLLEYSCLHSDQIIQYMKDPSFDSHTRHLFLNLMKSYQSNELI